MNRHELAVSSWQLERPFAAPREQWIDMIEEIQTTTANGPRVWAIGGGKGGVGKSVVTTNLAVAVARTGARVAVVDADLGGANLHTMVGVPSPRQNLSDFIARRVSSLSEIMIPTPFDNLWLISGAKALLETANPNYGQKGKILRHIATLDVDHVFLDLGAGAAFNVLDFFLVARKGVLVVVPEATSVENAYFFIKAAYFRKLKRAQPRAQVKAAIEKVMKSEARRLIRTPRDLMAQVMAVDPEAGAALMEEASTFSPSIIVNRIERSEQSRLGTEMGSACRDYFGINLRCLGTLPFDNLVRRSVDERRPAVALYPQSSFSRAVRNTADAFVGPLVEATS
jgi:flagellar biosynthesis protein FlhG